MQNNLEYLAGQVRTAASGATMPTRRARRGRVKAIYANAGDDVQSVIRSTALSWSSLDRAHGRGRGNGVRRRDARQERHRPLEDGTEYAGRIEIRRGNTLTVTLTDNGPVLGAKAQTFCSTGETVGTGTLYAHSA